MLTDDLSKVTGESGDHGGGRTGRRAGAGPDDHLEAAGERQGRGHRQQGPAGRARPGTVRCGPQAGPLDRLRGGRGRRHPDHRRPDQCLTANQIQSIHAILNGTSNFILSQMEENDADYAAALAEAQQLRLRRGQPDDGRQRQRRRSEAGHPGPPGLRRPGRLAGNPPHGHRQGRRDRHPLRPRAGLQHQAAGRGRTGARGAGTARLADPGAAALAAGPGPRGLQRHPRSGRRRGPGVLPRPGAGPDAHRLGRAWPT